MMIHTTATEEQAPPVAAIGLYFWVAGKRKWCSTRT